MMEEFNPGCKMRDYEGIRVEKSLFLLYFVGIWGFYEGMPGNPSDF